MDRTQRAGVLALAVSLGWISVLLYSVHPMLPFNPIRLPLSKQVQAPLWLPQGWAFFTRDPQEERVLVFRKTLDEEWSSVMCGVQGAPCYGFGLSRGGRALGIEAGLLLGMLPPGLLAPCLRSPALCLDTVRAIRVRNPTPGARLCGDIGVAMQPPIPWAWRGNAGLQMPSRVARLRVEC